MNNLDVAKKKEFFETYEKVKAAKTEKQAINTADIRIEEQIARFSKNSFSKEEELALYEDANSI